MTRAARIGLVGAIAVAALALGWPWLRPQLDPTASEVWDPPVPVVAPRPFVAATPPPGAIVLLGGDGLGAWQAMDGSPAAWRVAGDVATVDKAAGSIRTRRRFTDYRLHLEWRTPAGITGQGQARGNSGLFLGATGSGSSWGDAGYELQILDSYNNRTYANGQAGAIYKQHAPLANPMRPPGQWNTYDVQWTAPRFAADGSLDRAARLTARLNGVLVQDDAVLSGETVFIGRPRYTPHGPLPIMLQAHRDPSEPVSFRNIWLVEGASGM